MNGKAPRACSEHAITDREGVVNFGRDRAALGGHDIPPNDIRRRFARSLTYLDAYKPIVNAWYIFDSKEGDVEFVLGGENHGP